MTNESFVSNGKPERADTPIAVATHDAHIFQLSYRLLASAASPTSLIVN